MNLTKVVISACLAAVAASGCRRPAPAPTRPQNLLLVTIDTLRADRVTARLTPTLERLASAGVVFDHARSAVPLTLPSHATIMTGQLPPEHGVRVNGLTLDTAHPTIARVLHDGGVRTAAFVGAYVLDRRFGLAQGFDVYDDRIPRNPDAPQALEAERRGGDVADAAIAWLNSTTAPFFIWVHLYDPHAPYDPPDEFRARAGGNAYDGEVAYADAQVGRLLNALAARGWTSTTAVVVAGDHGEGLGDHGEATHGMLVYDSTLRVPFIAAGPGVSPRRVGAPVSLADLAPTVLSWLDRPLPESMHGRRLLEANAAADADTYSETQYPRAAGWSPLGALAGDRWKLIRSSEPELYDIQADPGERMNLAASRTSTVEAMERALEAHTTGAKTASSAMSADAESRLRALGYAGVVRENAGGEAGRNPAAVIDAWDRFEQALGQITRGDAASALPVMRDLAARFPEAPVFQSTYARALKDTGRAAEAMKVYRRALTRWPKDATMYHDLAVAARAAGDARQASAAEQAAFALDPSNAAAANGLGLLQAEEGQAPQAVRWFERATAADPTNAEYRTNLGNARRDAGDLAGAERAYREALQIDAASADAANGRGVLLVQQHRAAEAIPWFQRALTSAPDLYEARLNLGIAYQESGQSVKAMEEYRRVLAGAPRGSRERDAAGTLLRGLGSAK
ncbi:MAG TPA: sulfatase-like hydrolase/transferase [Vicinamibacterales bacterium]|nr:sulfatase-like hydrolase/transferase [Vicinamibacterales bacterium]